MFAKAEICRVYQQKFGHITLGILQRIGIILLKVSDKSPYYLLHFGKTFYRRFLKTIVNFSMKLSAFRASSGISEPLSINLHSVLCIQLFTYVVGVGRNKRMECDCR